MTAYLNPDDDLDDDDPYDSVAAREPVQPVIPPPSREVMDFISKKNASTQPSDSLENDPLMAQYLKDQSSLDDYRKVKSEADANTNIAQSFSQLAAGTNTPQQNPVYKQIAAQNQEMLGSKEQDLDRRRKVMDAIENRKARETSQGLQRDLVKATQDNIQQNRSQARQDKQDIRSQTAQERHDRESRLSDPQSKEIKEIDESLGSMKSIMSQLGSHSEWTGPVDGRVPDALVGADQVAFRSELGRVVDAYRHRVTGAGASAQELNKLEGRLPSAKDTYSNFLSKAKNLMAQMEREKGISLANLKAQGKNVSAFEPGLTAQTEKTTSDKIVISNGQETLSIDPSDLADAEKDGYKRL